METRVLAAMLGAILVISAFIPFAHAQKEGEEYPECVAGARQLSEPFDSTLHFQPHIANDPRTQRSLVVYVREDVAQYSIVGRVLGPLGQVESDEFFIHSSPSKLWRPQVIFITDFFQVTWQDATYGDVDDNGVQGRQVQLTGNFETAATIGDLVTFATNVRGYHATAYMDGVLLLVYDYATTNDTRYGIIISSFNALTDETVDQYDSESLTVSGLACENTQCDAREPHVIAGSDYFMVMFDYGDQAFNEQHNIVMLPIVAPIDADFTFPGGSNTLFIVGDTTTPNGLPGHDHHVRVSYSPAQDLFLAVWESEEFSSTGSPTGNHYIGAATFNGLGSGNEAFQTVNIGRFDQNWFPEVAYLERDDTFYVAYESGFDGFRHYIAGTVMQAVDLSVTWEVESLTLDIDDPSITATKPSITNASSLDGFLVVYQIGPVAEPRRRAEMDVDHHPERAFEEQLQFNKKQPAEEATVTFQRQKRAIDRSSTATPRRSPRIPVEFVSPKSSQSTNKEARGTANVNTIYYTGLCGNGAYDSSDSTGINLILLYPFLMIAATVCSLMLVLVVAIALVLNNTKAKEAIQTITEKAKGTENLEAFYDSEEGEEDMGQL